MHNQYLQDRSISRDWKERDFLSQIKDYIDSPIKKVLLIEYYFDTDYEFKEYDFNTFEEYEELRDFPYYQEATFDDNWYELYD